MIFALFLPALLNLHYCYHQLLQSLHIFLALASTLFTASMSFPPEA
jgi:hypothetical protein